MTARMAKIDRRKLLAGDKRRVWACVRDLGRPHTAAFVAELLNLPTERCYAFLFSLRTSRYLKFKPEATQGKRGKFYFDNTCMIPKGEAYVPLCEAAKSILTALLEIGQGTTAMIAGESGYPSGTITKITPQLTAVGYVKTSPARGVDPLANSKTKAYGLTPQGIAMAMLIEEQSNERK
jgi:hypothetical protein